MRYNLQRRAEIIPHNGPAGPEPEFAELFFKETALPHELIAAGLTKTFAAPAGPLTVLANITLDLHSADGALAILGPSGSGKSTLLQILGSLDVPTSGSLTLDGVNPLTLTPAQLARHRAERIGFVFQDHHLLPQLTAIENVLVARLALGSVGPADRQRAERLLAAVGLADRQSHLPAELSGGQRQRVSIARALMNKPALLICDEPTGDLDALSATVTGQLLHAAAREHDALLILATHSAALAATCARRLRLVDGQLTPADGNPGGTP
jgi:lipoprotein-releasing system ATP-binding protein